MHKLISQLAGIEKLAAAVLANAGGRRRPHVVAGSDRTALRHRNSARITRT
jgi:hypothetical protein